MLARARAGVSLARLDAIHFVPRAMSHARAGQPTWETHPHLFRSPLELTPWVARDEYVARRDALAKLMPANSCAIFIAAPMNKFYGTVIPSGKYRADADFAYFTGVSQPACAMVLTRGVDATDVTYALIAPKYCARYAQWDGERIDARACEDVFGADRGSEDGEAVVGEAVRRASGGVFVDRAKVAWDESGAVARALSRAENDGVLRPNGSKALSTLTHGVRWRKSATEIELIERSVALDVRAFESAYAASVAGASEADVMAAHEAACRIGGADRLAYPSVVGSGAGACVVHYHPNDKLLRDGDLVLMDAGCELNGYVSDITRTWPVNGKWTSAQEDVYGAVLDAHAACVRAVRADGETSLAHIHRLSVELLAQSMAKILNTDAQAMIRTGAYVKYYPHSVGHWLGMDTHDVPSISISTPFENAVTFTIEPGLYFPLHDVDVPKHFRGIGVRVEDDCVVRLGRCRVLSRAALADVLSTNAPVFSP